MSKIYYGRIASLFPASIFPSVKVFWSFTKKSNNILCSHVCITRPRDHRP